MLQQFPENGPIKQKSKVLEVVSGAVVGRHATDDRYFRTRSTAGMGDRAVSGGDAAELYQQRNQPRTLCLPHRQLPSNSCRVDPAR